MDKLNTRLKRSKTIVIRLFLIGCVSFTVVSVLINFDAAQDTGLSRTACSPIFIEASSEEELKRNLVEEFAPTLVFASGEPANLKDEVFVPYQLVPDRQVAGRYVWRGAVTYPIDYGASSFSVRLSMGSNRYSISLSKLTLRTAGWIFGQAHVDSHIGDVEMFEINLKPSEEDGYWDIDGFTIFPHGKRKTYSASKARCFRDSLIIYVSRGKHAMYPSPEECNHFSGVNTRGIYVTAEYCSVDELYYPSTSPEFNVGDSANPVNIFETSPTIVENELFQDEDVWGSCFWGGFGDGGTDRPCRSRFRWE